MKLWDNNTAAMATGGKAGGAWQASRVEIDSRRVKPGDLFVAIKGNNFDGHDFVSDALKKGAVAAMVSRSLTGIAPATLLVVGDTLEGLAALAKDARARSTAKFVGITGSAGKTSTKEMMKLALAAHGKPYATSGNFNNHIGMPLSLANLPEDTQYAVFEMGMNHAGEIAHLTKTVRPHVAIITNVEAVHMEFFTSVEAIADAKAEIFAGVEKNGAAVLNADNAQIERLAKAAQARGLNVLRCGKDAECRILSASGTITAEIASKKISYSLPVLGAHMAANSLLVLAAVHALGLDVQKSASALSAFEEPEGRGRIVNIRIGDKPVLLIDDSYNASPASMRAAFAKTQDVWAREGKGRKVAALGDMLELGDNAKKMHEELAASLGGFDKIFTAGALMQHLHKVLPPAQQGGHVPTAKELLPILTQAAQAGDILLVKGSHGSKMYEIAQALRNPTAAKEKKHAV